MACFGLELAITTERSNLGQRLLYTGNWRTRARQSWKTGIKKWWAL